MIATAILVAATLVRYLDPYTRLVQTDDARAAANQSKNRLIEKSKNGGRQAAPSWPVPNGLRDPLAAKLTPRIIYSFFERSGNPFPDWREDVPSPLFKVNQVGYLPWQPKFAYMGAWLGPEWKAWKPRQAPAAWHLIDAATGHSVLDGSAPVVRVADAPTKDGAPSTGEETYEFDFSSIEREGEYYICVDGIGRSENFKISRSAARDAFTIHMLGLYQKRCGIAKTEPYTHWTSLACHTNVVLSCFPPEEGTLTPKASYFDIIRANTPWETGKRVNICGGWHDAADYDRRPAHLNIVGDLCAVYLMRPENFGDGELRIPERANSIPDILDEAEWGLRHLHALQLPSGGVPGWIETTSHPVPGNVAERDPMTYAVSRATRASSLSYAAHASLLARAHPEFREKYLPSAIAAWRFAVTTRPTSEIFEVKKRHLRFFTKSEAVEWTEDADLPARTLVKAAINLSALTGDRKYIERAAQELPRLNNSAKRDAWKWPALSFSGELALGEAPPEFKEFFATWQKRLLNTAKEIRSQTLGAYAYRAPWWVMGKGWSQAMSWGNSHPLRRAQFLIAAHAITGDKSFLDAAFFANDFHNGCNPSGSTLTSRLGRVYPIAFLDLPSYVDSIEEYVPGITPYRWTYGVPHKVVEWVFDGDKAKAAQWPIWRRWGNLENQTVAASEYTVWETIAPAASVTGYLRPPRVGAQPRYPAGRFPGELPEIVPPELEELPPPAATLESLPGYWPLP